MGLNSTPISERIQIVFFGRVNAGKSSLINAITNQNLSIVSPVKGTTTDPVSKTMELLPLGPVNIIDTAGYDDNSELGELRMKKTHNVLNKTDIAIVTVDAKEGLNRQDIDFINILQSKNIKYIIAFNKSDLIDIPGQTKENEIYVSSAENINITELKNKIALLYEGEAETKRITGDFIKKDDSVILVTPIDSAAPKGRLILPQQRVIRDLLEIGAVTIIVQVEELKNALSALKNPPKLVITDSQAFKEVNRILPENIPLTSFSVLFAIYKGVGKEALKGVYTLDSLNEGDNILISEGCTHHRQCDDIGTVKIPRMIEKYTGKQFNYKFTSGGGFPDDLSKYKFIIHCGGCMLTEKEVISRYKKAKQQNIPISNYGLVISYVNGILNRCLKDFPV